MASPRFTPYDGSSTPFTIGLTAIELENWLETDGDLERYLTEKDQLLAEHRDDVFQEVEGSREAQREARDFIVAHLLERHSGLYTRTGNAVTFLDRQVALDDEKAPLITAGSLVADDLVVMENRGGWRVMAGYVAFPSSWSLKAKAGLTIGEVHDTVPGFAGGSRNDELINRMFDKIQPDRIVERFNWSLYPGGDLHWPEEKSKRFEGHLFEPSSNFIRVERQTLRKLPATGAILFTIRVYHDPIRLVMDRPELAESLAAKLDAMTPEQLAYKNMADKREAITAFLRDL